MTHSDAGDAASGAKIKGIDEFALNEDLLEALGAAARLQGGGLEFGESWLKLLSSLTWDELLDLKLAIRARLAQLDAAT